MDIDIKGIDKAKLLAGLYNGARPQGMGHLHSQPGDMSERLAAALLGQHEVGPGLHTFDYLFGRPIKVAFSHNLLRRADLYDRDAPGGEGSAQRVVDSLRT